MRISDFRVRFRLIPLLKLLLYTFALLAPQTAHAEVPSTLVCIIQHESGGNQFTSDGSPLISPTGDVGVMQLNLKTWLPLSKKMGLDIVNNAQDNIEFGIWLYNTHGPQEWTTYHEYCTPNNSE